MPPEPVPWDRKDFVFKERKHERSGGSDALGGGAGGSSSSGAPRWRDPYHGPREFPRASPRRPPPGHYRQGGGFHQLYPEDSGGHGCTPSRSDRFWLEDDSFRSSSGRYGSGRSGGGRESRGSFRRSPYWDLGDFSRQPHLDPPVTAPRSVAVPISPASQPPLKDQNDKSGGDVDDGPGTGHRWDRDRERERDRDHSLSSISWKPLKWTRPGSLTSSKVNRSEVEESGLEVPMPPGKETPIRSPVTSPSPADEGVPKKKPRLGWGQGLAKYEKQKVEGSVDASGSSAKASASETSPKVMGLAGSLSPATPCSATCSSSPASIDEKPCMKAANIDNATSHHSDSSVLGFQPSEEPSIKLDQLDYNTISNLTTLLADLLQPEDACSGDSTFPRHSAMTRLLVLKGEISKELEKTECEIDSFETEMKSLDCDTKSDPLESSITLLPILDSSDAASRDSTCSKDYVRHSALSVVEKPTMHTDSSEECDAEANADTESLAKVASKIGSSSSLENGVSNSGTEKLASCAVDVADEVFMSPELQWIMPADNGERSSTVNGQRDGSLIEAGSFSACPNSDAYAPCKMVSNLITLVMASNDDCAKTASQVFDKVSPNDPPEFDVWGSDRILSNRRNDLQIKEKLAARMRLLKFKERVLTLKFRALHHLWKEDLQLLSIKKHRSKSGKRLEFNNRSSLSSSQKLRSSFRWSRSALPGSLSLVPTTEIVEFTSKLLSDSQIKVCRNNLKMPTLILDDKERRHSMFISNNGLIEDPTSFEKEKSMINPWTQAEKEVFMEMLATFGKDFTKISSFLSQKTTADCIEFYYKNHKSESFREVKICLDRRKQWQSMPTNAYLVTSGKKWNREVNTASLEMLGAASVVAAHNHGNSRSQQKYAGRSVCGSYHDMKVSYGNSGSLEKANSIEISGHERETVAADVLAGICGALSSEAMSSCVTSSIGPIEKMSYLAMDRPLTPEVIQNFDEEDTCSDEGCGDLDSVDWGDEEKSLFVRALSSYGKDFARISRFVGTRSREQCKIFFSKARKCLGLDVIHQGTGDEVIPTSDINGGRSDTDDACGAEMNSAICSTQSCSKMDVDVSQSVANICSEGFVHAGGTPHRIETDRTSEHDVLGGINLEEDEGKVDKQISVLEAELVSEGDEHKKSQSDITPTNCDDAALTGSESVRPQEVEKCVDTETKIEGNPAVSSVQPVSTGCVKAESKSLTTAEVQHTHSGGSLSADGLKSEVDPQPLRVPETQLNSRLQAHIDVGAESGGSICLTSDSNASGNSLHPGNKADMTSTLAFLSKYQHQLPLDLLSCAQKKPLARQEYTHSVPLNSLLPDPSSFFFDGSPHLASQTINFEEHGNKRHQNAVTRDVYQQYLLRNPSLNQVDQPVHILRGYPLQVLSQKDIKRDPDLLISEKPVLLENCSKRNGVTPSNQFLVSDMDNGKSSGSSLSNLMSGMLCPMKSEDRSEAQLRPCSQNVCVETEEQSCRTGDVKLFGKILGPQSSLQKSRSSSHESDNKPPSPKLNRALTMKPLNARRDGTLFASRPGSNGCLGMEELPLTSFGFWDGSRIRTGFSSLQESAILANCQGSQPGMSFYPSKDGVPGSNGVLIDYQQSYMQHLSSDGKRLESFIDFQKRNGIDIVSGFQQQGRAARMGGSVMGGGGILIGSGGVSDPVAALSMHFTARPKVFSGEVDSWRGDIGR